MQVYKQNAHMCLKQEKWSVCRTHVTASFKKKYQSRKTQKGKEPQSDLTNFKRETWSILSFRKKKKIIKYQMQHDSI